ncbi:MAG: sigma-54-dependent Fis family transcriptional regulator [Deltaproteobacteria bacterium]|nr:sigma-54-dependent Fis family transcriptional regulator [Deltaproteobacteria bacterium]
MERILIVDDDRSIRRTLEKFLGGEGYEVSTAGDAPGAIASADGCDVMLLDLGLPGGSGFDVLTALADRPRPPAVVVVTARDDMQSTVKAVQLGAHEYLVKPVDIDRLRAVVKGAVESRRTRDQLEELVSRDRQVPQVGDILGKSPKIRDVWKQIGAVSTTRAPVLIIGESGTGKELVAKAIHTAGLARASEHRDRPFVAVNCTALAPGVLESELFGHVKGAFTGAVADRPGRFELAARGTIFLDEIAEIPLELQAKLLRVLQERTFERVGDAKVLTLDARVIAATHRDLPAMVAKGTFREDLFYRLRVVEIALPPLRDRAGDIPVLVEGLLAKINRDLDKDVRYVTPAALARLQAYAWPGNVRELENMLTRALVLAKSDVLDETLLPIGAAAPAGDPVAAVGAEADAEGALPTLREIERRHVIRVLAHTEWNKRRACAILDISRPTLDRKIEEFGLRRGGDDAADPAGKP